MDIASRIDKTKKNLKKLYATYCINAFSYNLFHPLSPGEEHYGKHIKIWRKLRDHSTNRGRGNVERHRTLANTQALSWIFMMGEIKRRYRRESQSAPNTRVYIFIYIVLTHLVRTNAFICLRFFCMYKNFCQCNNDLLTFSMTWIVTLQSELHRKIKSTPR